MLSTIRALFVVWSLVGLTAWFNPAGDPGPVLGAVASDPGLALGDVQAQPSQFNPLEIDGAREAAAMIRWLADQTTNTGHLTSYRADQLGAMIAAASAAHGVPLADLVALGWHESHFRRGLVSSAGACGLLQVMPAERYAGRPPCGAMNARGVYALGEGARLVSDWIAISAGARVFAGYDHNPASYAAGPRRRHVARACRYAKRHQTTRDQLNAGVAYVEE